jgi:putative selenium metabolism protein SsnA
MTTRFENGTVATLGKNNKVLMNSTVVTDGEKVIAVGDAAQMKQKYPAAVAVDCNGKVIMPGFICTHHHFYSSMARGMAIPGEPAANFVEILERLWWKLDMALSAEDITLSAQIPLIECIRNGTTTVIDHHASPAMRDGSLDLIESAVRQAGLRASLCYEVSDRNVPGGGIEENERFIKKVGKGDGQIAAMMGLHASFTLSDATLEKCVGIAKDAGVGCHIHVAEDASDRDDSVKKYGMPTVKRLDKMGASGEKSLFIHCVHIDDSEMDIIAATQTAVVHNPESNMNNAVGVTRILDMLKKGILVGLGTDGMSSDMLAQMRCAYLLHRLANRDPRVAFMEAPQMLLPNNAEICERQFGLKLGEIAVGLPADLAILDYQPPTPLTADNFLGHLIFGLVDATVDTTVCKGKILMKNKKIIALDEERIAARSRELAPQVWKSIV